MLRLRRVLIALLCVAVGALVGVLNPQPVGVDIGAAVLPSTLGISLLVALLAGALAGGLIVATAVVLPLRRKLHAARLEAATPAKGGI